MDWSYLVDGLRAHPYAVIVTSAFFEGRFTALVVGAFFSMEGGESINLFITYGIFVVMDILGDALYYSLGRVGYLGGKKFFLKRTSWSRKVDQLLSRKGLQRSLVGALLLSKIAPVGSKPAIFAAGVAKMPLPRFFGIVVPCVLVSFVIYMAVGYFFWQWIL